MLMGGPSMSQESTDPMAEVRAMQKLAEAVSALDQEAVARVLRWAVARYAVTVEVQASSKGPPVHTQAAAEGGDSDGGTTRSFNDLAELHAAASPDNEANRALVAGYWFQFLQGQADFTAQAVNSALKDLGHRIGNITTAFDTLK